MKNKDELATYLASLVGVLLIGGYLKSPEPLELHQILITSFFTTMFVIMTIRNLKE